MKQRAADLAGPAKVSLDDLFAKIQEGNVKELPIVIKADVQGSSEALAAAVEKMPAGAVKLRVMHTGVGGITETDILLAAASKAIVIGFNIRPEPKAAALAEREGVDVRLYSIIYDALNDIRAAMEGLLEPTLKERILGRAEGTHCPDVCPTTLAELAEVKRMLGSQGDRVEAIFVTVDPERDTPEILTAYMNNFGPGFVALRGTPAQTAAAAREFKVFYAKVPGKTDDSYTVDHTAGSYVIDTQGRLRLFARYGMPADALASDLKQLLAEG